MVQRTNATTSSYHQLNQDATTNEWYNERMLQRAVINKIRMLQRKNGTTKKATMNECYNEQLLSIKSGCYNERMVQRTMLQ
jgi:hypothetical protein